MTLPRFGGPVQLRGNGFLSPLRLPVSPRSRAIPINDLGGFVKKAFCKTSSRGLQILLSGFTGDFFDAAWLVQDSDRCMTSSLRLT